jgi:hypothetical protein
MTPQAILKARFSELADALGVNLKVTRQATNFYFTVLGDGRKLDQFKNGSMPGAWMTSGAGVAGMSEYVYGLPLDDVQRVLAESEIDPEWLERHDATVRRVAQRIREEGAFESLPILADALEEAGCDNAEILSHCRASASHGRTCWVIELLLGPGRRRRGK